MGYRPWGHKESGMTEWLTLAHSVNLIHSSCHDFSKSNYLFSLTLCSLICNMGIIVLHNLTEKDLHNPDNHDGVITHLEPDPGM